MDSDPLSELADIHLPEAVGIWPLAPGWWLVIAVLLALAVWAVILLRRHLHRLRLRRHALEELDRCRRILERSTGNGQTTVDYVNAVNAVLRRVALTHFPRRTVAGLTGERWVEFLRSHGNLQGLDARTAEALSQGRFARRCDVDPDVLQQLARQWIDSLYQTGRETPESETDPGAPSSTGKTATRHA